MPDGNQCDGGRIGVRLERLAPVQIAGSMLMVAFIAFLVLWNLPDGQPSQDVSPVVSPVVYALGMEQYWQLFAPDPADQSLELHARISFADKRIKLVPLPHFGILFGPYRSYRWEKLETNVCYNEDKGLLEAASWWFARQEGPEVRTVALKCAAQPVEPPGSTGRPPAPQVWYPYTLAVSS